MPSKTTSSKQRQAPSRTRRGSSAKTQVKSQDSAKLEFTAAGVETPMPDDLAALEAQRADLHKPGQVSKADAEQIDNDPGYNKDQLAHMREYWGLTDSVALDSEAGQLIEVVE